MEKRGSFGSKLGVVLASAGSAVGLGNIWRFPTEVGQNGGAAFILVYIAFVLFLALPVMVSEFVIGRSSGANIVHAFRKLAPARWWMIIGFLGVLGGVLVLSFYGVVAGWTLKYTVDALAHRISGTDPAQTFNNFVSNSWSPILYMVLFLLLTHLVVIRGIKGGIEKYSKLMMPLLLVIIVILVGCSLSMPGSAEGIRFLLQPDFSKVTPHVVLSAMGQAFFSLSVGIGCMATYASYFNKDMNLAGSAANVCAIDTMVAIVSGFIIFPAVFSVEGVQADAGAGLVFITLPHVFSSAFAQMPLLGYIFSSLFYLLLLLAALTSSISMHEICTAFVSEHYGLARKKAAALVTLVYMVLGTACSLSFGPWKDYTLAGMTVFSWFDFITAMFIMPIGGIFISLFAGWYLDRKLLTDELTNCGTLKVRGLRGLIFLIRWVAPIGVGMVFLNEVAKLFN
ncbi:MAG: sodium-dependent transporter [Bacteroidaceae bacterium]|nr:sodium-dependent transporter [Bacteroidaceae bacterium]MBR1901365.1 sodium-dependent transporter [Bacteroidaceae bacterium]